MNRKLVLALIAIVVLATLLVSCSSSGGDQQQTPKPPKDTQDPAAIHTSAAATIAADMMENAPPTEAAVAGEQPAPVTRPPGEAPGATFTPIPTTAPQVLFNDDFTSNTGWASEQKEGYGFGHVDGGYFIYVNTPNTTILSVRSLAFTDSQLATDAKRSAGPDDGYYGLVCRYQDGQNYYLFVVSPDGTYGIGKQQEGALKVLVAGKDESGLIKGGEEFNRIVAGCFGTTLTLSVNGQQLAEIQDDAFNAGALGLVAGTRQEGGFWALFDNLVVRQP